MGAFSPRLRSVLSAVSSSRWNRDGGTVGRAPQLALHSGDGRVHQALGQVVRKTLEEGLAVAPLACGLACLQAAPGHGPHFSACPVAPHDDNGRSVLLVFTHLVPPSTGFLLPPSRSQAFLIAKRVVPLLGCAQHTV